MEKGEKSGGCTKAGLQVLDERGVGATIARSIVKTAEAIDELGEATLAISRGCLARRGAKTIVKVGMKVRVRVKVMVKVTAECQSSWRMMVAHPSRWGKREEEARG